MAEITIPHYRPLTAVLWMTGAVLSFVAMAVAGRELSAELNTFELMAYRSVIGFAIVVGLILTSSRGFSQIKTRRPGLHVVRNLFHFAGQNLWFYGVAVIPLAQLVALEFTNPIWVALLAPFLLGERMTKWRLAAAVVGFIGVLVVARPGYAPFDWGHAAGLASALGFALNTIFTKELSKTDSILCVLFWMTLSQGVMGFLFAIPGGITMFSVGMTLWIVIVGVCGLTAHYCLTAALAHAPATVVAPMEFLRLPVIAAVGMLVYGEPLEIAVFVGAALIIAGNLLNLRAESRRAEGMVTQMLLGAALISGTVIIHAIGTLYAIGPLRWITSSLAGSKRRLDQLGFTILIVLWLFLLHSMEIWIWATFYWLMAEMPDFETALYFSTVTFTTLGYGDIVLDPDWRLLSAFQAANGILLFGWSTTYLLVAVRRIWEAELD